MLWLLILVMLSDGQPPRLVIKPVASRLECDATVANIKSTRPSAVETHRCVNIGELAGLGV